MSTIQITSIEEIKNRATQIVPLPGWGDDKPFYAKLRAVSIMTLARTGKIPNNLFNAAASLFDAEKKGAGVRDGKDITEMAGLMDIVCQEAFVEPSFEDVQPYLTDEQKLAVFSFTQEGVKALEPFRDQPSDTGSN